MVHTAASSGRLTWFPAAVLLTLTMLRIAAPPRGGCAVVHPAAAPYLHRIALGAAPAASALACQPCHNISAASALQDGKSTATFDGPRSFGMCDVWS